MDSVDVNDTCKRPISLQKHIWFVKPICFATPNGVATHSLRSPDLDYQPCNTTFSTIISSHVKKKDKVIKNKDA